MKKKIAIFANGWSNEYLELVLEGIRKGAAKEHVDLFAFVNFSSGVDGSADNIGEKSIFTLPDIKSFDGVILLANTINMSSERQYLADVVLKSGIPAVTLGYELPGIPYFGSDNYSSFYNMVEHLVQEHNVKKVIFVSGPSDNEESRKRLQATRDALQYYGIELSEDDVIEAEWSYYAAFKRGNAWFQSHDKIPDAVVCANDEMAIGICAMLEARGIACPEQVKVTGCDYSTRGQQLYPILTTIARHWEYLGYGSIRRLLDSVRGKELSMRNLFHSEPIIGESCGCCVSPERVARRLGAIREVYHKQREANRIEWHLRYIDQELAKRHSIEDLKKSLRDDFQYNHEFEGPDFMICLADDYFLEDEIRIMNPGKCAQNVETYIHLQNGKAVPNRVFPARQLLPDYDEREEQSHIYLFMPLHTEDVCSGYVVLKDTMQSLYEQTIYAWVRHIGQDMERVRQNIRMVELNRRLKEISITDGLTGLRNRTGCDTLAIPYLQKCQREGKTSAIVFADVNRMKLINDKYGHLQGDLALCTVAEAIKKTVPKEWIAVRYGGDEFIMVGACADMQEAEEMKERLAANLEEIKQRKKLAFPLTASFGAVIMQPGENYNVDEYLRKADEAMYETKQKYHNSRKDI